MKLCARHAKRKATLKILWADGRGVWYSCGRPCLVTWQKDIGRWAEVVEVTPVKK